MDFGEKAVEYLTADFRSGTFETLYNFHTLKALLFLVEIGLVIVAVVIATMTFKHLIDKDAATVALYRSLGATTGDIYLIYFLYILELCLLALIACCLLAGGLVGVIAMLNAENLSLRLQDFYQLSVAPRVYFYSFDQYFWTVVVAILVVAPLALAFSTHRFEESYVARKLKEDA